MSGQKSCLQRLAMISGNYTPRSGETELKRSYSKKFPLNFQRAKKKQQRQTKNSLAPISLHKLSTIGKKPCFYTLESSNSGLQQFTFCYSPAGRVQKASRRANRTRWRTQVWQNAVCVGSQNALHSKRLQVFSGNFVLSLRSTYRVLLPLKTTCI